MGLDIAIQIGGTSDAALADADVVEVTERMGEPTTYRLRYPVDIGKGDLPVLADARLGPGTELAVIAPVGGRPQVLVKGPIHGQHAHLEHGGPNSFIDVFGADRSIELDREVRFDQWSSVTVADVVRSIAARYGLVADVEETSSRHVEEKHTLIQQDTDLRFVRRLARRYGFHFWLTDDDVGVTTGHFRRPKLDGKPALELSIHLDSANVSDLDLRWDVERPTRVVAAQIDLQRKDEIDGAAPRSPLALLGELSLEDIAGERTLQLVAPADEAGDLRGRAEGALIEAGWFVRATCRTSLRTAGALVRTHSTVDLQGVGSRHSGRWFVAAVRHVIDGAAHAMEVELVRNAWGR